MQVPETATDDRGPSGLVAAVRGVAVRSTTVRGRIFVAFLGMSLLSGALGLYAVVSISHIGALINRTYDESLMSINYARASAADFAKMRSAFARRTHIHDAAVAAKLDAEIAELWTTL